MHNIFFSFSGKTIAATICTLDPNDVYIEAFNVNVKTQQQCWNKHKKC